MKPNEIKEQFGTGGQCSSYQVSNGVLRSIGSNHGQRNAEQIFKDIFLPQGYPTSVSSDYLEYQLWDTLQAFASSIVGAMCTASVLKGVGVGDSTATVLGAAFSWLLRDGAGMVGRILFAWSKGTQLDCESKRWRLFADVLNDVAFFLDLVMPHFPNWSSTVFLCTSSVMRSMVGVAGGATRAAITQHQARRNNLADVSAKDGSQETLVNLSALFCSLFLLPHLTTRVAVVWLLYVMLTMLHLYCNWRAVRSLCIDTVNRPRFRSLVQYFMTYQQGLTVREANNQEPLFFPFFDFRSPVSFQFGSSLAEAFNNNSVIQFDDAWSIFDNGNDNYLVIPSYVANCKQLKINVVLANTANHETMMKATFVAELLRMRFEATDMLHKQDVVEAVHICQNQYERFKKCLELNSWNLSYCLLGFDEWRYEWV